MTLQNEAQFEWTQEWLTRFEDTVRTLKGMSPGDSTQDPRMLRTQISAYEGMIRDLESQLADYNARTRDLAKAA